jgi:hypothetical protein
MVIPTLKILEYCEPSDVILREQYYIDLLKPEYNIFSSAGSSLGYKHDDKALAKIIAANVGIPKSEEHKVAISLSMSNRIKIEVLDLETDTKTIYNSMHETARALNISQSRISNYFSRNQIKPLNRRYVL